MRSLKRAVLPAWLVLNDCAVIYLSFWISYYIRFDWGPFLAVLPASKGRPDWELYREGLRAVVPLWILVFALWGKLYRPRFLDAADEFLSIGKGVVLGTLLIIAATFLYREYEYSRAVMGLGFFTSIILLFLSREIWKVIAAWLYDRIIDRETVFILGEGKSVEHVRRLLEKNPHTEPVVFSAQDAPKALEKIRNERNLREVYVSGTLLTEPGILDILDECEDAAVEIKILPDLLEMRMGEISVDDSLRIPILHLKSLSLHGSRYAVKRLFDLTLSVFILAVFSVPFLILSLLIVLDSKGGVFFIQDRIGFKEKKFKCFKFRTMRVDAEKLLKEMELESFRGGPAFKMKGDPRITRVGKWIRKFSLDETAQIINVLKGEMSLIGPRPQVLKEAEGNPDWARKRYRVLPGITGLWQVSGRADLSYEDMMRLDIFYLENWSPGLDLKILLKTLPVVLGGKGAY